MSINKTPHRGDDLPARILSLGEILEYDSFKDKFIFLELHKVNEKTKTCQWI